ncbi:MAG: endonuclease/exonuclease/phosphatase family protein [Candidatus Thorarchaeota archaeon]
MSENEIDIFTPLTDTEGKLYQSEFETLKRGLDTVIPQKVTDSNILIATWNIKSFGDLNDSWETGSDDTPKRHVRALKYITEIVSRFDVVAIQEVTGNLRCLRHMLKALGPDWGLLMTDEVMGSRGNNERLAFVFDMRRVKLSGLAGEFVIPEEEMGRKFDLKKQFARTPYAVGFKVGGTTFVLITLHVLFGKEAEVAVKERAEELGTISGWLSEYALNINAWEHNLIALGDFNIDREGDIYYEKFIAGGLEIHQHFHDLPRTIFDIGKPADKMKYYDQIAWYTGNDDKPALTLEFQKGGYFNFTDYVFNGIENKQLEWRMSDHFPLWAEFKFDPEVGEDLPTIPTSLTDEQEKEKLELDAIRRRAALTFTELENAFVLFMTKAHEAGLSVTREAEEYLVNYLNQYGIVNEFKSLLEVSENNQSIPSDGIKKVVEEIEGRVGANGEVTKLILKCAIREVQEFPYQKKYCRLSKKDGEECD